MEAGGRCCEPVVLAWECWGPRGGGHNKKSFKAPDAALGTAERDTLVPAPALAIPGGFE